MKTIIAPTDLTKTAEHAVFYAAEMAKKTKARLLLLHVFRLPYPDPHSAFIATSITDAENQYLSMMDRLKQKLRKKFGTGLKIDYAIRFGVVTEEIEAFAKKYKADLIVMGMRSVGTLEEKLLGSVTTDTIRYSKIPVLIVNKNNRFGQLKNIAFSYDYQALKSKKALAPLINFAKLFKSHVSIVHVSAHTEKLPNKTHYTLSLKLEKMLAGIPHTFFYTENESVNEGLNQFVKSKKINLIFMLPHHHSFFARLFKETNSKKVVFHSKVPVLTFKNQ